MKKKFLSNAPPALSHAPTGLHTALNANKVGTTAMTNGDEITLLNDTTGAANIATG